MKKHTAVLMIVSLLAAAMAANTAELKNEHARQEGNRLVLTYDLEGKEKEAEVLLSITVGGQTFKASDLHIEGDVGKLKPGRGKRITWNVLRDFPKGLRAEAEWELTTTGDAFKDPTTGIEMVFIKGGCFQMGDTFGDGESDEKPVHEVCVSDFHLGKYEVTVGQFRQFVNDTGYRTDAEKGNGCWAWDGKSWKESKDANWRNPGFSQADNHPVACVSWNDATAYTSWQSRKSGKNYRLPTEAEWEYAARAGGKSEKWAGSSSEASLGQYAWYSSNSGWRTHPVGTKKPNGLGLYDMSGNVWEWTSEWYGSDYYTSSPQNNPGGPSSGSHRVNRGSSWSNSAATTRAANRYWFTPDSCLSYNGFRLALPPGQR